MKRCQSCQAENFDDAAFCDRCGAALGASAPAAAAPAPEKKKCPVCGAANDPRAAYCSSCGMVLDAPAGAPPLATPAPAPVAPVAPPPEQVAPPPPELAVTGAITASAATEPVAESHPRVVLAASGVFFDLAGRNQVMIGRIDPVTDVFPEIDLTEHGGDEGGVSRRHCKITRVGDEYFVEDLNSSNGTWLGATRLHPHVRTPLKPGEQLRLGKITLDFVM